MVSSWKLESSSTQTSGRACVLALHQRVQRRGPILPATSVASPPRRHMAPASAVTVVLPLVPVMASTCALRGVAAVAQRLGEQFDIADHRHAARRRARAPAARQRHARADRDQIDAVEQLRRRRRRSRSSACGTLARSRRAAAAPRACRRRARARPARASQRAIDSPVSPRPSTRRVLPFSSMAHNLHQRSFSVDRPEQHQHHGDDPEAHHDLRLLPALQLVVVVQRRHAEDALAAART